MKLNNMKKIIVVRQAIQKKEIQKVRERKKEGRDEGMKEEKISLRTCGKYEEVVRGGINEIKEGDDLKTK